MALWVLVGHVLLLFGNGGAVWTLLADNTRAVDIFMALSGFAMFFLLDQQQVGYPAYLWRRLLRLYPAYLVSLVVSALLAGLAMSALAGLPGSGDDALRNDGRLTIFQASLDHAAANIAAHLTMLHGLVPGRLLPLGDYAFVGQAWSISVEWQFYVLAPLFFVLTRGSWLPVRVGLALALAVTLHKTRIWLGVGYLGDHIAWFLLGIVSFQAWRAQHLIAKWLAPHLEWGALAAAVLWAVAEPGYWQAAVWIAVFGACLSAAIGGRARPGGAAWLFERLLTAPPLLWLGRISYSLYLTHMVVAYVALAALERWAPSWVNPWAMLPLTLAGTLAVSHMLYLTVERPFIELGRGGSSALPRSSRA